MELPFVPGILILLVILIIITRVYMILSNQIGEEVRGLFVNLWEMIKKEK